MSNRCKTCGGELPVSPEPRLGRSRRYCSPSCRKAAELEQRRIDRRIERLEGRLSDVRASCIPSVDNVVLLSGKLPCSAPGFWNYWTSDRRS